MRNKFIICIFLFLIAFLSYYNSLKNNFIDSDDISEIVKNPHISNLSFEGVKRLLLPQRPNEFGYYPVRHLLDMACFAISGQFNPFFFHLMSVLMHCFTVIGCFFAVSLMCGRKYIAFWTALLFAVHPCHTEAVNWISSNCHLFAAFFGFLTIYFYILKEKKGKIVFYILSIVMYILSNMSKTSMVTLPFLLLLYEYWTAKKRVRFIDFSFNNPLYSILPFFCVSGIFTIIHLLLFPAPSSYVSVLKVFKWSVLYKFPAFFMKYLGNALLPLSGDIAGVLYLPESFDSFYFTMLVLSVVLIIISYYLKITNQKFALFGIISFIILLLPGIIQIEVPTPFSMRLLYFPSFGIYLTVCLFADGFFKEIIAKSYILKCVAVLLCIFIFVGLINVTIHKNEKWYSSETIWSSLLNAYPERMLGLFRLSQLQTDVKKKTNLLEETLNISEASAYGYPHFYQRMQFICYSQLGRLYIQQNEDEETIKESFYEWHNWEPQNAYPLWRLGSYYEKRGLLKKAQFEYERAVEVYSEDYRFWESLARIYEKQNLTGKGEDVRKEILKRWPDIYPEKGGN